jgi:hypothetical protein
MVAKCWGLVGHFVILFFTFEMLFLEKYYIYYSMIN